MSTQKGNVGKGGQKYQNVYKFKHNKNSVKTEKIMNSPLDKLCQRCYDIIKWKMDYRKYKPLKAMAKCNLCQHRTIIKAYRTICDSCATTQKNDQGERKLLCTKCGIDTLTEGFHEPPEGSEPSNLPHDHLEQHNHQDDDSKSEDNEDNKEGKDNGDSKPSHVSGGGYAEYV